jgi:uncharacterized protein (TIGR03067 family)
MKNRLSQHTPWIILVGISLGCDSGVKTSLERSHSQASNVNARAAQELNGSWQVKSAMIEGQMADPSMASSVSLTLSGDDYSLRVGSIAERGKFTFDRILNPNRMIINVLEGPSAGSTMLAIVDFPDPQTMRLCYDLEGSSFPSGFDSTTDNKLHLITYARQPE